MNCVLFANMDEVFSLEKKNFFLFKVFFLFQKSGNHVFLLFNDNQMKYIHGFGKKRRQILSEICEKKVLFDFDSSVYIGRPLNHREPWVRFQCFERDFLYSA